MIFFNFNELELYSSNTCLTNGLEITCIHFYSEITLIDGNNLTDSTVGIFDCTSGQTYAEHKNIEFTAVCGRIYTIFGLENKTEFFQKFIFDS